MSTEEERLLIDILSWNVYVFRMLHQQFMARKNEKWAEVTEASMQQNIAMVQLLLPDQPLSPLDAETAKLVPQRRMTQIEELEALMAVSSDEPTRHNES